MKSGDVILMGFVIVLLFVVVFSLAGFGEFWDKITGRIGEDVAIPFNITVTSGSSPVIYYVWNDTMTDVSSGPTEDSPRYVMINFSVSDDDGYDNLNDSTAKINFTLGGASRSNSSCERIAGSDIYANYTCNVTLWWFDGTGYWSINASISDTSDNAAVNTTETFYFGTTAGFSSSPANLTWGSITPGAVNTQPSNNILMNNTGNLVMNVTVNATNLYGETNPAQALWATNFTVKNASGCGGTQMVADTFTLISTTNLTIGNYTIADGRGQEEVYFCLDAANAILDAQSYSTAAAGSWTIKIIEP